MDIEKYMDIKSNLVLSKHAKDNLYNNRVDGKNRSNISLSEIILCMSQGQKGFCGNRRFKTTHYGLRLEVIWKKSEDGCYVVITYYRIRRNKYINPVDAALEKINKIN